LKRRIALERFFRQNISSSQTGKPVVITFEKLESLKGAGFSIEELLEHAAKYHGFLLHGSPNAFEEISPNEHGKIFAANWAPIAMLKAITCRTGSEKSSMRYPLHSRLGFSVVVTGDFSEQNLTDLGWVYLISGR
jgi:hypothetical protein